MSNNINQIEQNIANNATVQNNDSSPAMASAKKSHTKIFTSKNIASRLSSMESDFLSSSHNFGSNVNSSSDGESVIFDDATKLMNNKKKVKNKNKKVSNHTSYESDHHESRTAKKSSGRSDALSQTSGDYADIETDISDNFKFDDHSHHQIPRNKRRNANKSQYASKNSKIKPSISILLAEIFSFSSIRRLFVDSEYQQLIDAPGEENNISNRKIKVSKNKNKKGLDTEDLEMPSREADRPYVINIVNSIIGVAILAIASTFKDTGIVFFGVIDC